MARVLGVELKVFWRSSGLNEMRRLSGHTRELERWYNHGYTLHMKTAISIPDELFSKASDTAERMGIPRSRLFALAVAEYIQRHRDESITEKIDSVLETEPSRIDAGIQEMQLATIADHTQHETW